MMSITRKSTLIILDWDDTLFPTTWVVRNGIDINNAFSRERYIVYFNELDLSLSRLLNKLMKCGKVIIVTNALPEWVRLSSSILPRTHKVLEKIKVVSARKIYQSIIGDAMAWKILAFKNELISEMRDKHINNVISVGDADYEYQALISLYKEDKRKTKLMKSVKFMKDPTHDILLDQLGVLESATFYICGKDKHLDLNFKERPNRENFTNLY